MAERPTQVADEWETVSAGGDEWETVMPERKSNLPPRPTVGGEVSKFASGAWKHLNPVTAITGLRDAAASPIQTGKALLEAQGRVGSEAGEAFQRGDYATGVRKGLNWLLPVVGPVMDAMSDRAASGDVSGALGEATGFSTAMLGPGAARKLATKMPAARIPSRLNPVEESAVAFGEREGIPLDLATQTGNRVARNAQTLVQNQPGGAGYAQRARAAQEQALTASANRLANRASPIPFTKEQAANAVVERVERRIGNRHAGANQQYGRLRAIEENPANVKTVQVGTKTSQSGLLNANGQPITTTTAITKDIATPVDQSAVKASLGPVYERMKQAMPIAQQQASPGLKAVENILNSDDVIPASVADSNLSAVKSIARGADSPDLRTVGQGLAAKAVGELESAVQGAVAGAGPEATQALRRGRMLTKGKYRAAGVLDKMKAEPVQIFKQLDAAGDANIDFLRGVAKEAPAEMPQVGRAYLQGLFDTATAEGGFGKAQTLQTAWGKLGPETKKVLFRDAKLVKDLDDFFLLAKKISENPNPSGTAPVASLIPTAGLVIAAPQYGVPLIIGNAALSRMFFNPRIARKLKLGMRLPSGKSPAAALTASQLIEFAGEDAKPLSPQQ